MVAKSKPGSGKVQCPYCKEWVTTGASRCPHCQKDYTAEDTARMERDFRNKGFIGCGLVAVALFLGLSYCSSSAVDTAPEKPTATAKADATAFYSAVIEAGSACDNAFTVASGEMSKGDPVRSYRAVEVAESACLPIGNQIRALKVPTSVGKSVSTKLSEARDECASVFESKWSAMNSVKKVIGGNGGVAEMASAEGSLENVQAGTIRCVAGLAGGLTELGVDLQTLPKGN